MKETPNDSNKVGTYILLNVIYFALEFGWKRKRIKVITMPYNQTTAALKDTQMSGLSYRSNEVSIHLLESSKQQRALKKVIIQLQVYILIIRYLYTETSQHA